MIQKEWDMQSLSDAFLQSVRRYGIKEVRKLFVNILQGRRNIFLVRQHGKTESMCLVLIMVWVLS